MHPGIVNIVYFSSSYKYQPEARFRQYCRNLSSYLLQAGPGALDISFLMGFTNFNSVHGWQRRRKADAGILPAFVLEFFMKLTRIVTFLFLLVCLVSEGHAQGVGRNGRSDSALLSSRDVSIIKELQLTDSQVKETRRIGAAYSNRTLKLRSEIIGKSIELRNLLHDPSASEESIRAKGKEIEAIDGQLIREKIEFQIEMRKVLTPEQLQRWYMVMDQQPATKKPIR